MVKGRMVWCAGLAGVALFLTGCGPKPSPTPTPSPAPAVTVPLSLTGPAAGDDIRIGLVLPPVQGEGSEYRDAAEGAQVAAYRFRLSGAHVTVVAAQEDGTAVGIETALASLAEQSVSGIVVGTAGAQLRQALAAAPVRVPVLLPYDSPDAPLTDVWTTGPSRAGIAAALRQALTDSGVSRPFALVEQGWTLPSSIVPVATASVQADGELPGAVVDAIEAGIADSVVIAGSATTQAGLVVGVQQGLGSWQAPVFLTPEAQTPAFGEAVTRAGAGDGVLISVGSDTDDPAALEQGLAGQRASAFFVALRLAAGDDACKTAFGDAPFASVAQSADTASHDAVVALVRAVEKAGSTSPDAITTALSGLTLDQSQAGLAGPALRFASATALADADVVPVFASAQNPGERPQDATDARQLFWFATKP